MTVFICRYCESNKPNHNSLRNHERLCKKNENRDKSPFENKEIQEKRVKSNQFLKAKEIGITPPENGNKGKQLKGTPRTEETKKRLSRIAIERGYGGVRKSNKIRYKGKSLGSSYELTVVKNLEENKIAWDTCKRFEYTDPTGKTRTYTPDIYLPDFDVYLDPKNDFLIHNNNPTLGFLDSEKIKIVEETHKIKVFILNKEQLSWSYIESMILDYQRVRSFS